MKNNALAWSRTIRHAVLATAQEIEALEIDEGVRDHLKQHPFSFAHFGNTAREDIEEPGSVLVMDCSSLDLGFLVDTGVTAKEEVLAGEFRPRLPGGYTIFEFADVVVLCEELAFILDKDLEGNEIYHKTSIECVAIPVDGGVDRWLDVDARRAPKGNIEPPSDPAVIEKYQIDTTPPDNDYDYDEHAAEVCVINSGHYEELDDVQEDGLLRVLGLVSLLDERLVSTSETRLAPRAMEAKRRARGKRPLYTDYRVVTLNLAASRRRAAVSKTSAHESPMLHWRRGHWRTLAATTEFERRVWVRRCLVGDPNKGFCNKHYRVINEGRIR